MKKIIILLLLASCSPNYHVKRALKKGWTPEKEKVETIRYELFPVYDTVQGAMRIDTIKVKETRTVYQDRPLLRYETKLIRDTIRLKERSERHQKKLEYKEAIQISKQNNKRSYWWLWLIIGGVLVGFRKQILKLLLKIPMLFK